MSKHGSIHHCSTRHRVDGNASILDFGYLGIVYEILDYSRAGARLRGPRQPPGTVFDLLLHVSNRFIECRARLLDDDLNCQGCVCVAFEEFRQPAFLSPPDRLELSHELSAQAECRDPVTPALPPALRQEIRMRNRRRRRRHTSSPLSEERLVAGKDTLG